MSLASPTLALYAKPDGIQMRITAKAATREEAARLIEGREAELRLILKDKVWGIDDDTPEGAAGQLLREKGLTMAAAESFTGGLLAYSLSSAPQSREFFKGGLITADSRTRVSLGIISEAGVKPGPETASRMARLAREQFTADIGLGIDGSLETAGGSMTCEAFIAISLKNQEKIIQQTYPSRPYLLVKRCVMQSLISLRTILAGL
jgi:nicotinamide-nucleotide amidase